MKAIKNCTLVMTDHYIPDSVLLIEDGKIIDFGKKLDIPTGAEVIDAEGLYVGPGLVDIHTHSDGYEFIYDNPKGAMKRELDHGVTSVLPALYFSLSKEEYIEKMEIIENARKNGDADNVKGYYMEGPYLNPKYGCDREKNKWKGPIDRANYEKIIEYAKDKAKVWCVAPERENIVDFVKDVKKANPDAVFSVAHSEATPQEVEALIPYGLRIATHHTNATGTLNKYPECRGVCVDEAVWYNDSIYAELICDSRGIHVDPYMLRLVKKIKGRDKLILIADAFVGDGPVPPGYEDCHDINFDKVGEIAGSKLTLDIACHNMIVHTGISVCDAFHFASYNPAKAANLSGYGEIKKGAVADLIFVDHMFNVHKTILKGETK